MTYVTSVLCPISTTSIFARVSFVCSVVRLLVEGSPRSPLALQQRNVILSLSKDLLAVHSLCNSAMSS